MNDVFEVYLTFLLTGTFSVLQFCENAVDDGVAAMDFLLRCVCLAAVDDIKTCPTHAITTVRAVTVDGRLAGGVNFLAVAVKERVLLAHPAAR